MYQHAQQRIAHLQAENASQLLRESRIGLEKECLRVDGGANISQQPHPRRLGSALTNPYITTDYSEALLEFITPPCRSGREAIDFLRDEQQFVYQNIENETLWATSMPCMIRDEASVPIAQYGSSNDGLMKTVYRRGLAYRYGKVMQVIAGVHFNYSFSENFWRLFQQLEGDEGELQTFISERYFGLIRNLQRMGWLIPYLFGASPAVCKSFLQGQPSNLEEYDRTTYYGPYATSLRMGDIGYQNNKENEIGMKACYDSLEEYIDTLTYAIETEYPGYANIGVKVDGEYRQLNANLLQIENEYYSTVRPKQPPNGNEKPTIALARRGVSYFELRSLDVNAFDPLGVGEGQLYFLEALALFCLVHESPRISPWERAEIDKNEMEAAQRGRQPGLELKRNGVIITLQAWALEIIEAMQSSCALLDQGLEGSPYTTTLAEMREMIEDPDKTPSARMLAEMRASGESFSDYAARKSDQHGAYFKALPIDEARMAFFAEAASVSLAQQANKEAEDVLSFDDYLKAYYGQQA